jgi:hypothetical protein
MYLVSKLDIGKDYPPLSMLLVSDMLLEGWILSMTGGK